MSKLKTLTVQDLLDAFKHCDPNATVRGGGLFNRPDFVAVNIDDDGEVCLIGREELEQIDPLRQYYGSMVTKDGIQPRITRKVK